MLSWIFVGRYKQNNQRWETKLSHKLDIVRSSLANGDPVIFYLDSTCSWMLYQWERCSKWLTVTPFVLRRAQVKKKNIFSKMDFNHEIRWKQCKSCKYCPGHSDCQSLTLNVMMQVLQFVMNCQLYHSLRPNPRQSSKSFMKLRFSKLHINYFVLQSSMSLYFQLCTFFMFF